MARLAFAGGQPAANLAQRLRSPQVAEQHGHELTPTGEAARVVLGHGALEIVPENICNIWLKMLDTRITAAVGPPDDLPSLNENVAEPLPPPLNR